MNLKTDILVFLILLASSQDYAGKIDHYAPGNMKGSIALGQSGYIPEKSWIEDSSDESPLDLKEQSRSPVIIHQAGVFFRRYEKTEQITISRLDPLFLDRPPPMAFPCRMIEAT